MEIRLLGLVEASHDGHVVPLGGAKPRALLAILALHANAPVSADRLIEGLWGERPPATAPKLVQVLVSQLRKQLAGADAEIVTRGRGYELRVDPDAVDALRFERLLTSRRERRAPASRRSRCGAGRRSTTSPTSRSPRRRSGGSRTSGCEAREAAIDAALADGRHAAVLGELDELVREHPLRERLHAQRMLALYRCGRQAEALEAFRDARQRPARRGRARAGSRAAPPQRRDPAPGPGPRRSAAPRRFPGRARPAARLAARRRGRGDRRGRRARRRRSSAGSDGLGGIAEDATGVDRPRQRAHRRRSTRSGTRPTRSRPAAGSVWTANGRDGTVSRVDRGRAR